jgi:eukaryotic-like serine/threonine-protein kinase
MFLSDALARSIAITADRNLLFGLVALQNGIINQGQLVAAFQAWTLEKSRNLVDYFEARGDLDADDRVAVEALVARHLKRHSGDVQKSLAAVPAGKSTRESLERIGDPDIEATLGHVSSAHVSTDDGIVDRTTSYDIGSPTALGQRFRVLRPHARGGLGAVFVALDAELNREVALKQILEKHADDPVSRGRFLLEAEVTGGLEHPGIVPVYGLGTYSDGRPYYAMRLIKGDSLKEAIDDFHAGKSENSDPGRSSLELRKLLRAFTDVCNAIEYAHSRGVLHRDIKPSNIIVGRHGETLMVDWGLAKATGKSDPSGAERTLLPSSASGSSETLPGSALGTPAYMSPEQAEGNHEALGPRSDVYSLGATLYYLLTGQPAVPGDDIGAILRAVQRGELVPPRQVDPSIDAALEAVCLKAMALRPEDRYATCRALADDVERWMADEPVSAWHEPLVRRARRWARRNRTAVSSLAAAILMALVGTAAVLAVQTRANGRLMQANGDLASASAREKQRFDLAMDAIKLFHGQVGDDLVLKGDQFKLLRDKLLKGAADFYAKLEGLLEGQIDPASRSAMGNAYFELGELTSKIGNQSEAIAAHRKALALRRELASEAAEDIAARADVATSLRAAAALLTETGKPADALASLVEARDLLESLPHSGVGDDRRQALLGTVYRGIGWVLTGTGKTAAAMSAHQKSVEILTRLAEASPAVTEFRSDLADTLNNTGTLQVQTGKPGEAMESFERAMTIQHKLAEDNPANLEFGSSLGLTHIFIGNMHILYTGKPDEAMQSFRRALVIYQKLTVDNPAVTVFQNRLAAIHNNVGELIAQNGKPGEAMESFELALAIHRKLVEDNLVNTEFRNSLAASHNNIGTLLAQSDKLDEAMRSFQSALLIYQKLADENPSMTEFRSNLAVSHTKLADILRTLGQTNKAGEDYNRAIAIREKLVRTNPDLTENVSGLGSCLRRLGLVRLAADDTAMAVVDTRRAVALYEGLPSRSGEEWYELACCHATIAGAAGRDGSGISAGDGEAEANKTMELLSRAVAEGYHNANVMARETALDDLRGRPDFQLMMMDLAFPARPFAR